MLPFVRCGNDFTLEFGDIDEPLNNGMCSIVDQFRKLWIKKGKTKLAKQFIPVLDAESQRIEGQIGWGYPDELVDQLSDLKDAFDGLL